MRGTIMIQGTMSGAGKSLICAALCRIFAQDGYKVAPFKAQNMALNSYITEDGAEIGRAQAMQAFAARTAPSVLMNPVLLKPTGDTGSQVIVNGEPVCNMSAKEYYQKKSSFKPAVIKAYESLKKQYDIIVIEGAGSPAEINLREDDFVNMGMAQIADCPVLMVGDIDRGGVFAQLYGTLMLLTESERKRVAGLIINKFRGDKTILDPGIDELEKLCHKKVLGVVPYTKADIEEEDSLADILKKDMPSANDKLVVAVVRLPHISNFTDMQSLSLEEDAEVVYVTDPRKLDDADIIILPGTKNTVADLKYLKESGIAERIVRLAKKGVPVFGICGGLQILGESITDNEGAENEKDISVRGLGLLKIDTEFQKKKLQKQVNITIDGCEGIWHELNRKRAHGYEIHAGLSKGEKSDERPVFCNSNVAGTYIHGFFDSPDIRNAFLDIAADKKGISRKEMQHKSYGEYRDEQLDILAKAVRESLDMKAVYELLDENAEKNLEEIADSQKLAEYIRPAQIEGRSMEIIEETLRDMYPDFDARFPAAQLPVIKRAIHTSADFEYAENLYFSEGAVEKFKELLGSGVTIVTDTRMGFSGINKKNLAGYGCRIECFIDDEEVAREAKEREVTRAVVSVEKAARLDENVIYVVGNAPTALIKINELFVKNECRNIKAVIAVPVGFVNVVEAKELILGLSIPHIVARGRKGGSNVAAAIVNALLL